MGLVMAPRGLDRAAIVLESSGRDQRARVHCVGTLGRAGGAGCAGCAGCGTRRGGETMPHDLSVNPIHLGLGSTAVVEPEFTGNIEWYMGYMRRHADDGTEA